jgi:alpha-beta hydrolase superfamily lysophospholipase
MAHGFSATKEMGLDRYAEVFAAAGLAALVYDHRNLGASDGEPRQLINPWAQARDYRYALTWLAERPEVDATRLAVWGSSFSGGEAIVVGAVDDRVRAVVANVPFASLGAGDEASPERFAAMRAALLDESGSGPADSDEEPLGPLRVVTEPEVESNDPVFLGQPESTEWFLAQRERVATRWENRVLLRAFPGEPLRFDPAVCLPYLQPPLLMVVASEDRLADTAATLAAYERACEPKQLELIEGHHFVPYDGDAFEHAATCQRDFLVSVLAPDSPTAPE